MRLTKEQRALFIDKRFPTGYRTPQPDFEGKGEKGKRCNVNACQMENSANYLNLLMGKYYCIHCIADIAAANKHLEVVEPEVLENDIVLQRLIEFHS